jgi:RNA polymerase sigma factor (sigma-70 family)
MRPSVEELYRVYGPVVLRRARAILGDEQSAKDAMQEVFLRVLRSSDAFRGDASVATWLYRITTNYCLNLRRDSGRRIELLDANTSREAPPDGRRTADDRAEVRALLSKVPRDQAEVAVYHFIDEMSQDEIAQLLGVSRRYVRDRLEAFLTKARSALGGVKS